MKRFAIALAASLVSLPALAADLPVKAVPLAPTDFFYNGGGIYVGVNAIGEGGTAALNSLVTTSGALSPNGALYGVTIGYLKGNATSFFAIEAMIDKANIKAGTPCPVAVMPTVASCSVTSDWEIEGRVKYGGPLSAILNALPNNPFGQAPIPGIPDVLGSNTVAPNMHPYVFVGALARHQQASIDPVATGKGWDYSVTWGMGMLTQMSKGVVLDMSVERVEKPNSLGLTGVVPAVSGSLDQGASYRAVAAFLYRFSAM